MKGAPLQWVSGRGPMIFGWLLFGHALPYVGFERIPCSWDGEFAEYFNPVTGETDGTHTGSILAVEWLGCGLHFGPLTDIRQIKA